jgi:hypothetical protein
MENIIQYAQRILKQRNVRMALATLKAMEQVIKDHASLDPSYYVELNNLMFRIRTLLEPLERERIKNRFAESYQQDYETISRK